MRMPLSPDNLLLGMLIGHADHPSGRTGATVVLTPRGAVGGVAVRGGAPGTRETDLLRSGNLVDRVHGVLLTGGSAFGLAAADGVVRWLLERGSGWPTAAGPVPIVPAAVLYDLRPGALAWPDAATGYAACEAATAAWPAEGLVGAGRGATVGMILGMDRSSPGGIGAAQVELDGAVVGALMAVNAFGHIVEPRTNQIVAGAHHADGSWIDDRRSDPPRTRCTSGPFQYRDRRDLDECRAGQARLQPDRGGRAEWARSHNPAGPYTV